MLWKCLVHEMCVWAVLIGLRGWALWAHNEYIVDKILETSSIFGILFEYMSYCFDVISCEIYSSHCLMTFCSEDFLAIHMGSLALLFDFDFLGNPVLTYDSSKQSDLFSVSSLFYNCKKKNLFFHYDNTQASCV